MTNALSGLVETFTIMLVTTYVLTLLVSPAERWRHSYGNY
jgi:hypothetical protein